MKKTLFSSVVVAIFTLFILSCGNSLEDIDDSEELSIDNPTIYDEADYDFEEFESDGNDKNFRVFSSEGTDDPIRQCKEKNECNTIANECDKQTCNETCGCDHITESKWKRDCLGRVVKNSKECKKNEDSSSASRHVLMPR